LSAPCLGCFFRAEPVKEQKEDQPRFAAQAADEAVVCFASSLHVELRLIAIFVHFRQGIFQLLGQEARADVSNTEACNIHVTFRRAIDWSLSVSAAT